MTGRAINMHIHVCISSNSCVADCVRKGLILLILTGLIMYARLHATVGAECAQH